jgi:hypothetical protein
VIFLHRLRQVLHLLFHGDAVETELDSEVREFYQTMVDRYVERGVSEQEARRLARIKFGHPENVKEEVRDSRTGSALASTMRNVSYALRTMRKAPLFACVPILTLGVGIAANTTIFSVVSRFVLRHPPVGDPGTLMALHTTEGAANAATTSVGRSTAMYASRLNRSPALPRTTICFPPPSMAAVNRNASGDRLSPQISSISRACP